MRSLGMYVFKVLWTVTCIRAYTVGAQFKIGDTRVFKKVSKGPDARMIALDSHAQASASSLSECAAQCKRRPEECFSYVFDKSDQTCRLGSWSAPTGIIYTQACGKDVEETSLSETNGTLYTSACCADGYLLHAMDKQVTKCVRYVETSRQFADALKDCEVDGGQLITFKTDAEYDFVQWSMDCLSDNWVGIQDNCGFPGIDCRKNPSSRKFYWVDGEELSTSSLEKITTIFDNAGFVEGCVQIGGIFDTFNDNKCSSNFHYVCEKVLPEEGIYC
ncbi:hypothetical protein EGW08_003273 [Elysia chlorotica]|uniref:C-type lectin domain-containing protein n=1 Tax=Elysia chlorotica TaxID=188477 RepID=A0A433U537_ELYCH|nr:hypothetical protein EGW08_003273 [Elysia chlorotica]